MTHIGELISNIRLFTEFSELRCLYAQHAAESCQLVSLWDTAIHPFGHRTRQSRHHHRHPQYHWQRSLTSYRHRVSDSDSHTLTAVLLRRATPWWSPRLSAGHWLDVWMHSSRQQLPSPPHNIHHPVCVAARWRRACGAPGIGCWWRSKLTFWQLVWTSPAMRRQSVWINRPHWTALWGKLMCNNKK